MDAIEQSIRDRLQATVSALDAQHLLRVIDGLRSRVETLADDLGTATEELRQMRARAPLEHDHDGCVKCASVERQLTVMRSEAAGLCDKLRQGEQSEKILRDDLLELRSPIFDGLKFLHRFEFNPPRGVKMVVQTPTAKGGRLWQHVVLLMYGAEK